MSIIINFSNILSGRGLEAQGGFEGKKVASGIFSFLLLIV